MDAIKRYGGALAIATVPSAAGGGWNYIWHNIFQGSQAHLNQGADYIGLAGLAIGVGLGVIGGVTHAVTYRSRSVTERERAETREPAVHTEARSTDIHIHFHRH